MGRGADRPSARLCRATLHFRRSRTRRRCQVAAFDLDQLSGLTSEDQVGADFEAHWSGWYDYFPWEDQRAGLPAALTKTLASRLKAWSKSAGTAGLQRERWQRVAITFGLDEREWNEELVLQRYELLYEAGLIPEAVRDGADATAVVPGRPMSEITAAFSRPGSHGCAPRSNTAPWCRTDAGGIHPAATATQR